MTDAEWREAVTLAEVLLDVDAARQYGLITGGPDVDIDRCLTVIRAGRQRGIVTTAADVNRTTEKLIAELCEKTP